MLVVSSSPSGATVLVDGKPAGQTPLELALTSLTCTVSILLTGYAPVERTIQLEPGTTRNLNEALRDTTPPEIELAGLLASTSVGETVTLRARATDNDHVLAMRLFINGSLRMEHSGAELEYAWETRGETAGINEVRVEAVDADENVGVGVQKTVLVQPATPTPVPPPIPSPTPAPAVRIYEVDLSIPTYPYASFLHERLDTRHNWPVLWLDRAAYEASRSVARPRQYQAVILENRYLKLVFLPELGGRLYQCIVKSTGQGIFYQNAVIKPSFWGPLGRDENWWLAAGGMEWAVPVQEHGYDWGVPWAYRTVSGRQGASIVLTNSSGADRVQASVTVTLPAESRSFEVQPRVTNPTSQPQSIQFWINAALSLGSSTVTPQTHLIVPAEHAVVHSTGDSALPGERQTVSWPVHNGRDLSVYGNWRNWLGVFFPDSTANYAGVYSDDTSLGVARIYPPDLAPGLKLFGFGADFPARTEYSDDGSQYFELWGGPCRSFWAEDDLVLEPGRSVAWREVWLPFTGLRGLSYANEAVVVFAELEGAAVALSIAPAQASTSELEVSWNGALLYKRQVELDPSHATSLNLPLPSGASVPGELKVHLRQGAAGLLTFVSVLGNR